MKAVQGRLMVLRSRINGMMPDEMETEQFLRLISRFAASTVVGVAAGAVATYIWPPSAFALLLVPIFFVVAYYGLQTSYHAVLSMVGLFCLGYGSGLLFGILFSRTDLMLQVLIASAALQVLYLGVVELSLRYDFWDPIVGGALSVVVLFQPVEWLLGSMGLGASSVAAWSIAFLLFGWFQFTVDRARELPHIMENAVDVGGGIILAVLNIIRRMDYADHGARSSYRA